MPDNDASGSEPTVGVAVVVIVAVQSVASVMSALTVKSTDSDPIVAVTLPDSVSPVLDQSNDAEPNETLFSNSSDDVDMPKSTS